MQTPEHKSWVSRREVLLGTLAAIGAYFGSKWFSPESRNENNIQNKADYILSCQNSNFLSESYGAINNIYSWNNSNWIVPRENALAMLALDDVSRITGDDEYRKRARLAIPYLASTQQTDGGWCDQYDSKGIVTNSKSPTQTAEVMIALERLGSSEQHYEMMKNGAKFLMSCQNIENKTGIDDGLICGGKDENGNYQTYRWTQDNAFAYRALISASDWAEKLGHDEDSNMFKDSAEKILSGINNHLYNDSTGAWHRYTDESGNPTSPIYDWGCYAPIMIGQIPVKYDPKRVANFILNTFVIRRANVKDPFHWGVIQNTGEEGRNRVSPGFAFQAAMAFKQLGYHQIAEKLIARNDQSTLFHNGGWIDWETFDGDRAPDWQRFIDTNFYDIAAREGLTL